MMKRGLVLDIGGPFKGASKPVQSDLASVLFNDFSMSDRSSWSDRSFDTIDDDATHDNILPCGT